MFGVWIFALELGAWNLELFFYLPAVRSELFKQVSRIVIKLGTGVLTDNRKQLDPAQLEQIVAQLAALRQAGKEVVVVTSGAVGAGMGALGYNTRPKSPSMIFLVDVEA